MKMTLPGTISAAVASRAYDAARLAEMERRQAVTSTVTAEPHVTTYAPESDKARFERTRTTPRRSQASGGER